MVKLTTGDQVLQAAREFLTRYVVLTPAQSITMAMYALLTWCYETMSRTVPYVEITGVSGSGKTILMEATGLLARGPEQVVTMKPASIVRLASQANGALTLLCDEAERLASNSANELRGVLASGYRQGGEYPVTVGRVVLKYSCWCPKIFASTRSTVNVIHNRCIPIWMERGKASGSLSTGYDAACAEASTIVAALRTLIGYESTVVADGDDKHGDPILRHRHSVKIRPILATADWLSDRDQEIWTPIFTLAATLHLSDTLTNELVAASIDLTRLRGIERKCDHKDDDEAARERSYATRLLADVRSVIQSGETAIASTELLRRVQAIPTAPWRSYRVSGLTEITMAALLGAFAIGPMAVQLGTGRKDRRVVKGYKVAELRAGGPVKRSGVTV